MATRLMEIVVHCDSLDDLKATLKENDITEIWVDEIDSDLVMVRLPIGSALSEDLTDTLESQFKSDDAFRILLLPVEAVIPRPHETEGEDQADDDAEHPRTRPLFGRSVSREELYEDIRSSIRTWPMFLTMATLSTVVAALGLAKDDVAVIIGAMVIAPLLGPNIGLALAITLGDTKLGIQTFRVNAAGLGVVLGVSAGLALLLQVDPSVDELYRRSQTGGMDIAIALAAGVAGSLAFTSGISTAFIGVMVAVALLPPAAACGLFIGEGQWRLAVGAMLLTLINIVSVNFAAVVTFLVQGIRPARWAEKGRARKATIIAVSLWVVTLGVLIALMIFAKSRGFFDVEFSTEGG